MKYLCLALLVVMCVGMTGCLTAQQNSEINRASILLAEKLKEVGALEDQLKDIVAKLDAGIIPVAEGKALYSDIESSIKETTAAAQGFQATIDKTLGEGGSKLDVTLAIILNALSIGGSLLGVRLWRGGVNNRSGDIGVRT